MGAPTEGRRAGIEAVRTMTALQQRMRLAHPTHGVYQAAEIEFWWTIERSTDTLDQLFWFDDEGEPVAAAAITDFGDGTSLVYDTPMLVPVVLPDASPAWTEEVVGCGVAHASSAGIERLSVEARRDDLTMLDALGSHGFERTEDAVVVCWLDTSTRTPVSPLADGYRLAARSELADRPHHMAGPRRPRIDERLHELSLYRPDLDLVVLAPDGEPAAYSLFWFDPVTATGVVEPMRTHDEHQRRGLGRHLLTTGIDLLARAGATRVSIAFEPDNPASGPLYQSVGFEPHNRTDVHSMR